jgi:hypothetical protein
MDRLVTRPAYIDPLRHLFPVISLLEPLVRMNSFRNEVVEVIRLFTLTKFTNHLKSTNLVYAAYLPLYS